MRKVADPVTKLLSLVRRMKSCCNAGRSTVVLWREFHRAEAELSSAELKRFERLVKL